MLSSGMLRRVALVRTDVFKERSTTIIRVTRIGELLTSLKPTHAAMKYKVSCVTLMMEAQISSETLVLPKVRRRNIPKNDNRHSHRRQPQTLHSINLLDSVAET
jgi:hypothetical protein